MDSLTLLKEIRAHQDDNLWQGFHGIEKLGDDAVFRWTGPSTFFTIGFDFPRTEALVLELRALKAMSPATYDNLFVDFDGRMILAHHAYEDDLHVFRVAAPPRLYGNRTKMVFHLPENKFEQRKKALADRGRSLGLAFFSLRIMGLKEGLKTTELRFPSSQGVETPVLASEPAKIDTDEADRKSSVLDRAVSALRSWSKPN